MRDNVAYLFPGQGTRYGGAALDFLEAESPGAKALFELASGIFAMDMAALLRDGDEQTLKRTDIAQPALTLCSLAAAAFLGERGFRPA
ncbi:MAG: malonyl CoA-ACP transacylase, partial [Treponema sp.]|nr:malonyl CoA-ACP transacylase [Treponema sp.]